MCNKNFIKKAPRIVGAKLFFMFLLLFLCKFSSTFFCWLKRPALKAGEQLVLTAGVPSGQVFAHRNFYLINSS